MPTPLKEKVSETFRKRTEDLFSQLRELKQQAEEEKDKGKATQADKGLE